MVAVNTSFFSDMLQSIADRSRALIRASAASRRTSAPTASSSCARRCCPAAAKPPASRWPTISWRDYAELTTGPRIAFFEALAQTFGHDRAAHRRRHRGLAAVAVGGHRRRAASRQRAAAARTVPPAQPRARRHRGAGAHARAAARRHGSPRRPRRRRPRFRPSVLVLVQPRISGAAPHRLVDAGVDPGKDHPLRGGARDSRLGRSAPPHRSARPALLRVLSSGAGRRAADLRRGRADPRNPRRDRADPRRQARASSSRSGRRRRCSIRSPIASAGSPASPSAIS